MAFEHEYFDYAEQEMAGIVVPTAGSSSSVEQIRKNAGELVAASPGLLLSEFDFGDELIVETDNTESGQDGYLAITLVSWGEQHEIPLGVPVRAAIDETNLPELKGYEDIYISGSSLENIEFSDEFQGQIRAQCNLWFSPLSFTPFENTIYADYPDEELQYFFERGVLEYRNRGYFKGYIVGVSLAEPPLFLPTWVKSVSMIDDFAQRAQRLEWKSPHYLMAKTCIIDTDEA